jgi:hypothetical protein
MQGKICKYAVKRGGKSREKGESSCEKPQKDRGEGGGFLAYVVRRKIGKRIAKKRGVL